MNTKLKSIIQLEGVDAVGKSTISKTLKERYEKQGLNIFTLHFPIYNSSTGKIVKEYLTGELAGDPTTLSPILSSLYYTADRLTFFKNNPQVFTDYDILIFDRSYMSNFFFQTAKYMNDSNNYFNNVIEYIKLFCNLEIMNTPLKDHILKINTIVLRHSTIETNFELMSSRGGASDMHEANKEYLKSVDDNMMKILRMQNSDSFEKSLTPEEFLSYSSRMILCSEPSIFKKNEFTLRRIDDICDDIMKKIKIE